MKIKLRKYTFNFGYLFTVENNADVYTLLDLSRNENWQADTKNKTSIYLDEIAAVVLWKQK